MDEIKRLLDANINRAAEGIRVLEDISRFCYNNMNMSEKLKKIRHSIRKNNNNICRQIIEARDIRSDIGPALSSKLNIDGKQNLGQLAEANFKRTEEALRCCEEALKVLGMDGLSRKYEALRFEIYSIEKEFHQKLFAEKRKFKLNTNLYCITSEEHSKGRDNIEVVERMIDAGIKVIQYRDKNKSMLEKYRQCVKIREMTLQAGVTFIINDHADLAKSVCADGVHLGQDDLPVDEVRKVVGTQIILGVSTHSPEQALKAVEDGADYIGVGPLLRTFTKKGVCDPVGLEYLDFVLENIHIPHVAIGGIKLHNIGEVRKRGAKCIALVTEIVSADDINGMIGKIKSEMERVDENAI